MSLRQLRSTIRLHSWLAPVWLAGILAPCFAIAGTSDGNHAARVAEEMATQFMKGFDALDDDLDGRIDLRAMIQTLRAVGYGTAQPIRRGPGQGIDPFERFEALDSDGDGLLRGDEAGPYMQRTEYFADGEVTLDEFRKAWNELSARRGGRGRRGGGGRGATPRGGRNEGRSGGMNSDDLEFLAALDANRDRTLTSAEAREAIEAEVADTMGARTSLDADRDGVVTAREYGLSQPKTGREVDADGLDGHARGHFEREDYDRNGVITAQEIAERVARNLGRRMRAMQLSLRLAPTDRNEDGNLDLAELRTLSEDPVWAPLDVTADSSLALGQLYGKFYNASTEALDAIERAIATR